MLRGTLAAAVTPLRDGGACARRGSRSARTWSFSPTGGLDGILALGTTGEGILLSPEERRRVGGALRRGGAATASRWPSTAAPRRPPTPWRSPPHAAAEGADAVAVIGPPYYALDEEALVRHFAAAAEACRPLPFYLYEFRARCGYSIPLTVIERLRELAPNLAGLKVSNQPFADGRAVS